MRHLKVFCRAAERGNFTRAAEELYMTQSGVSRSVNELEKLTAQVLFKRLGRHIELTDEGAAMYERLVSVLGDLEMIIGSGQAATVRLGFTWLLPEAWAEKLFPRITEHSGVVVEPVSCDDPLAALRRGHCDAALVPGLVDDEHLTSRVILREPRVAVVPATSALAQHDRLPWQELARHPIIINRFARSPRPDQWEPPPEEASLVWCHNFAELLELVAAGRGVGTARVSARRRAPHPAVAFVDVPDAPVFELSLSTRTARMFGGLRDFWEQVAALTDPASVPHSP